MPLARTLLLLVVVVAVVCIACTPQGQCDTLVTSIDYCGGASSAGYDCHGRLLDPYNWESNPPSDQWLNFPPNVPMTLHPRDAASNQMIAGQVYKPIIYISSDTLAKGADATQAAGNQAIFYFRNDADCKGCIIIRNETCAQFFVRVVLESAPEIIGDAGDQ